MLGHDPYMDFYPMTITTARYGGTYEGGAYVLIAGIPNPRDHTDAFAGNIPCMEFWERVDEEGPVIEIEDPRYDPDTDHDEALRPFDETVQIFATAGPHPVAVFETYTEYMQRHTRDRDTTVLNEVIFEHQDLYAAGRDDPVARHKLAALAGARVDSAQGANGMRVSQTLLHERYDTDCPPFRDLDEEAQADVRAFVDERAGQPPLTYMADDLLDDTVDEGDADVEVDDASDKGE